MIYLIRHGKIEGQGRYIGRTDLPLTHQGEKQMLALRHLFDSVPIREIYCSRLIRSSKSAAFIRGKKEIPIYPVAEFDEIHLGQWEAVSMADIKKNSYSQWEERGNHPDTFRPEGGESFNDLYNRVVPAFDRIAGNDDEKDILIIGHAGVNRMILCHALGMPVRFLFRLAQDYGCLNLIEKKKTAYCLKVMNACIEKKRMLNA